MALPCELMHSAQCYKKIRSAAVVNLGCASCAQVLSQARRYAK